MRGREHFHSDEYGAPEADFLSLDTTDLPISDEVAAVRALPTFEFHRRSGNMDAIQSRRRHLAKTITWRLIGTIDTVLIGWVVTGDPWIGIQVGGVEMVTRWSLLL